MRILAFDVGGTAVKSAIVEADGSVHHRKEHAYPTGGRDGVLQVLKQTAAQQEFDAIGISTAGLVDTENGSIIFCSEAIPNYTGTALKSIMEREFQKPVWVVNDVNAAALGEAHFGAGKHHNDFICLTYGTSIGGAIVINKRVYGGKNGFAGEIGHIVTHFGGKSCVCGSRGCYGEYASASALVARCRAIDPQLHDGRKIFAAFGQEAVQREIDSWIEEIVHGLVTVTHIFNPSLLILGGGIMKETYIVDQVGRRLASEVMPGYKDVQVVHAYLENTAGLMGAAKYAEERCSNAH